VSETKTKNPSFELGQKIDQKTRRGKATDVRIVSLRNKNYPAYYGFLTEMSGGVRDLRAEPSEKDTIQRFLFAGVGSGGKIMAEDLAKIGIEGVFLAGSFQVVTQKTNKLRGEYILKVRYYLPELDGDYATAAVNYKEVSDILKKARVQPGDVVQLFVIDDKMRLGTMARLAINLLQSPELRKRLEDDFKITIDVRGLVIGVEQYVGNELVGRQRLIDYHGFRDAQFVAVSRLEDAELGKRHEVDANYNVRTRGSELVT
jgi:hypothetical protein